MIFQKTDNLSIHRRQFKIKNTSKLFTGKIKKYHNIRTSDFIPLTTGQIISAESDNRQEFLFLLFRKTGFCLHL